MSIRYVVFLLIFGTGVMFTKAQNRINTYDFAGLPESLLNNPSYDVQDAYHFQVPLTAISAEAGSSGIRLWDVFADNTIPFETKLKESIYQMSSKDVFLLNQKNDFFNLGFKLHNGMYLSFGFYEELDLYATFPKSISELYYEGTTLLHKQYTIDNFVFQADLLGVYHVGIQKKIADKIAVGARFKLYSGAFNIRTAHNAGNVSIAEGTTNTYLLQASAFDTTLKTSGIVYDNYDNIDSNYLLKKILLNGNKGLGFDFGLTYYYDDNLTISGSIIDLGIIFNNKDNTIYHAEGSYATEGINLNFNPDNPMDYWQELEDDFNEKVDYSVTENSYVSWRPLQLNAFVNYSFGRKRYASCTYDASSKPDYKKNAIGALLQLQKRPENILPAVSIFYEKNISNIVQARLSYTADKFSQTNFGAALSLQMWKVNLYAGVNNLFAFSNLAKANTASLQFGLVINSKKIK